MTPDGARHMVECGVRTVGVDYLSVGAYGPEGDETHRILLGAGIWVIEGLQLEDVEPGSVRTPLPAAENREWRWRSGESPAPRATLKVELLSSELHHRSERSAFGDSQQGDLNASLSFSVVILLLFSFAFEPEDRADPENGRRTALAGVRLRRSAGDQPEFRPGPAATTVWTRCSPRRCQRAALFFGKAIANFVLLLTLELICLPIFGLFYNVNWTRQFWQLMLVVCSPPGDSRSLEPPSAR